VKVRVLRDLRFHNHGGADQVLPEGTKLNSVEPIHGSWKKYRQTHRKHVCVVWGGRTATCTSA